jgi:hypothetical protein
MEQTPKIITLLRGNQIISFAGGLHATEVQEIIQNRQTKEIVYDETFQAPTTNVVDNSDFPFGTYEVIYQYDDVVQKDTVEITMGNLNKIKLITDPPIGGIVMLIAGRSHNTDTYGLPNQEVAQQIIKLSNNAIYYDDIFPVPPGVNTVDLTNAPPGEYKSICKYIDNGKECSEEYTFTLT